MKDITETSIHYQLSSKITNSSYHKRSSEKFVSNLIYNVCIAPVYTLLATCGVFTFYLASAFFVGFFSFKWAYCGCANPSLTTSYDHDLLHLAIGATAVVSAIFSTFLASTDKLMIASFTALLATIGGLLAIRVDKAPEVGTALGTVLSVLIYWFYLEPGQQTVKDIVASNYFRISFLTDRKTQQKLVHKQ